MIGTVIGNYRVTEKIGAGGMGVVYKAIETQLDRPVALKALHPHFTSNSELMERFRAEARAQAQMNHPNVATLYTFLVQDNVAYMVMEFVEGEAYDRMVQRRGPIPSAEALPAFRQALAGISYAHRLGILHRDIKPSNIMLNREGIVKVMDFGLAKIMGDRSLTATGVRLGTVYYMSPEQIMNRPADVRSDVYSLGATLYEILTGRVPFQGDSDFHILNAHVNTPPPLLSGACPTISRATERAVLKALAKNPDERFQSADEFAAALDSANDTYSPYAVTAVLNDTQAITTMTVRPAPMPAAAATSETAAPSHRGKIAAAVVAILALLIAAAWLLWQRKSQSPAETARGPAAATQPATTAVPPLSAPTTPTVPVPAPTVAVVIPPGTVITVRLLDLVDTDGKNAGEDFTAEVATPVTVGNDVALHARDEAVLRLEPAGTGGHFKKPDMRLRLVSIAIGGRKFSVMSAPNLIKGGRFHSKRLDAGTRLDFELTAPLNLAP